MKMTSICIYFSPLYSFVSFSKGSRMGWKMPLVFVLCANKKTSTYNSIFEQLKKSQKKLDPKQINVDCELAAINAAQHAFPNVKIQLCWFHIKQSVIRNLSSLGLKERYENDEKFANEIRMMIAVAFLPVGDVIPAWEKFIQHSETLNAAEQKKCKSISYFVNEYFEKNYIGQRKPDGSRKKPRFAPYLWNVHESTMKGKCFFFTLIINAK